MATQISKTLRRLYTVALGLCVLFASAVVLAGEPVVAGASRDEPRISQEEMYSCDFKTELSPQWKTIEGKWERKDGSLARTVSCPVRQKVRAPAAPNRDSATCFPSCVDRLEQTVFSGYPSIRPHLFPSDEVFGKDSRWNTDNAEAMMGLAYLHDSRLWHQRWTNLDPQRN